MVDRYTEWADWTGWADESAERRPRQGTGTDSADGNHNLAKVRVAGSNPVVRSISGLLNGHFLMAASHSQSHLTIPSQCETALSRYVCCPAMRCPVCDFGSCSRGQCDHGRWVTVSGRDRLLGDSDSCSCLTLCASGVGQPSW